MGSGFWLLPAPWGHALLIAHAAFLFLAAPPLVARVKGFGGWARLVPSGLLGFLAVLLLPSARAPGLADAERAARARHGRRVGGAQAVVGVVAIAAAVVRVAGQP
ncbi:hypothetical protein R5W24_006471 [Gemmata sp. JC717]|uniref:hypothetical protein n=1 Tax=Gemmata algarum TaxID=2975278 RepID=UPI0021BB9CE7|nr:hypothetical protein [Gemmata algarum]MDY3557283.1 hypothetical protein [Gemmata algarum]